MAALGSQPGLLNPAIWPENLTLSKPSEKYFVYILQSDNNNNNSTSCNQTITITIIHPQKKTILTWDEAMFQIRFLEPIRGWPWYFLYSWYFFYSLYSWYFWGLTNIVKSPEEDLTGEKTITSSLKVSIVIYESYEKESLDGLPNVCLKSDQTFCLMQIQIRKVWLINGTKVGPDAGFQIVQHWESWPRIEAHLSGCLERKI